MPEQRANPASTGHITRTVGALALLNLALPVNVAVTLAALARGLFGRPAPQAAARPRTVLISGGKMTKALQLARSMHGAGHRVILIESAKYRFTGHRFSRAVDKFYAVPTPHDSGYVDALLQIVRREGVDVYIPVCSPAASYYDALAKKTLAEFCEVLHCDAELIEQLDDKYRFSMLSSGLGLGTPDTRRITAPQQVTDFDFAEHPGPYVLKSMAYDPVHRLDLTPLPRPGEAETASFAASKGMTETTPWIMQAFVDGQEYCTHSTVRAGEVQVFCCCRSSAFQLNYEMVDKPEIEAWVRHFVGELKLTGQVSFDFIESVDGRLYAIECNPRTHSAITMFYNHPDLARAYLDPGVATITPLPSSRPTYWLYQELWRLLSDPRTARERLRIIARGKDAIFDWTDPLPFLLEHHLQLPWLLLQSLRQRKPWLRIDFNIGKLVESAGD